MEGRGHHTVLARHPTGERRHGHMYMSSRAHQVGGRFSGGLSRRRSVHGCGLWRGGGGRQQCNAHLATYFLLLLTTHLKRLGRREEGCGVTPGFILLTIHYSLRTTYTRHHLLLTTCYPLPATHYPLLATTYLAHLCHLEGRRDDGLEAHIAAMARPSLQEVARSY